MSTPVTFTRGRKLAIGLNVLVASLLAPVVAGLLLYLAFRPEVRRRVDLTSRASFTLAERTLKVLEELKEPVDVYTCFRPLPINDAGQPAPGMEAVTQTIALHTNDLLREFEVRGRGKLRSHAYDPNSTGHLARIDELSRIIGEAPLNLAVVACGSRRRVVRMKELAEYDAGTRTTQAFTRPTLNGFRDEEALTKAILSVTQERAVKLFFLRGHGERDPAAGLDASGNPGLSVWATGLIAQNYELHPLDLGDRKTLTKADADVVVVCDPVKPLTDAEVDLLVRYAKDGGRLALFLGLFASNSLDFPLLDQVLGLARTPNPVCQVTTFGIFKSEANVFFTDPLGYGEHAIVKPLKSAGLRMVWRDACALSPGGGAGQPGLVQTPLVWTGNDAWIDLPGPDRKYNHQFDPGVEEKAKGPSVLAYAVERPAASGGGRAVVVGGLSPLDNAELTGLNAAPGNRPFGLDVIDWLTEREQLIALPPKPFDVIQVDLTAKEFGTIFLYVVAGVPAVALLLGIAVFWLRRT